MPTMRKLLGVMLIALACARGEDGGTGSRDRDEGPLVVFNAGGPTTSYLLLRKPRKGG